MIEVYNDCKDKVIEKPQPLLELSTKYSCIEIIAVNAEGASLAHIWKDSVGFSTSAKGALISKGYSTDWANWDSDGRFKSLT